MSWFEKKFGKYAIRNISLMLIMCYAVGYVLELISPWFVDMLTLNPYEIMHGQIWRLVTWIIVPPDSLDIFTILMLFFYYSVGSSLERVWGTYQYNLYLFMGMGLNVLASFIVMACCYLFYGDIFGNAEAAKMIFASFSYFFSTYYINMSILLAYAATFPNAQVLLMFVIPVKMKWMGIAYGVLLTVQLLNGTGSPVGDLFYRFAIGVSLLNFAIFYLKSRHHLSPQQIKRRQQFKSEMKRNTRITKHKCAICGRTEDDDPNLEFRFCSKCEGNYEYCQNHLFTHEHVKR